MHFFITKTHNLHLNFFLNQSAFIGFCIVLKHFPQKNFCATTYFCYFGKERSLDRQSIDMVTSYRHFCRVVKWLERQDCDRYGPGSKPTRIILLCPWERHLTALCLVW